MNSWPVLPLSEVVKLRRGHDLPARLRRPGQIPVVSSGETEGWHDTGISEGPGVVIGRATNIGRPKWVPGPYWPHNTTLYVEDFRGNEPRWIYYLFQTLDLTGFNSGSVQAMLNRNFISNVPIPVPPLAEQQRIAAVLRAIDDLIETDRALQQGALASAKATYECAVASSGVQLTLGEAGSWLSGGTPATSNPAYWGGSVPWISASSLKTFFLTTSDRKLTEEGARNGTRIAPEGAILFVVRGMSLKSEFRVGVAQRDVTFGQDCKAIVVDEGMPRSTLAVGLLTRSDEVLQLVDEASHGTGRLQTDRIENLAIRLPPATQISKVEATLAVLLKLGAEAEVSISDLTRARDELLPLLMSGKVRVSEDLAVA